jgi:dimethylargininase
MIALTRAVPPSIADCELTHLTRTPIDYSRARAQHAAYERALEACGCRVQRLPDAPELPDSVFVEDAAVVFDEIAIVARPGAASRRAETASVAAALREWRPLAAIEAPGALDGGDVLRLGRRVFVGLSTRTNEHGARQLEQAIAPFGYRVTRVRVRECLHLKSAATAASAATVLLNPAWIDAQLFDDWVAVDPGEPGAANVLCVGGRVLAAAAYPRTRARLAARGLSIVDVDASELAKAEGALTCCSLVIESTAAA